MSTEPVAGRVAGWGRRLRLGAGLTALATLLAGCATPMNAREDAAFHSHGYAADRPTVRPVRSFSSFSDSLMCMDHLFREAQLPTTLITSKQIPDFSGRVAVATKDMVITALSQMSRLSNAFRYVDYEVDIARQDTVQNLTTILLNNNQIQLQRPALYVSGAVAFVDQNVIRNNMDIGTSASRLETGYSRTRNATVIGLEMHLGDFRSRTIIPGLDSANEIVIGNGGQGLDLAGRIGSYGVQFTVGRDYAQGSGPAVRTLVELAMIELVGKWARLPYWQCLTLEQNHPDFQRQLRDWYDEGDATVQRRLVRSSLATQGYRVASEQDWDRNAAQTREAIARYQADQGMVVTGVVDFATYERALRSFVGLGPDGKLVRVGWEPQSAQPAATAATAAQTGATVAYGAPPEPRTIDLQIENILIDRKAFEVGEQIFLSATVSRASYLSCYMGSANGTVIRLLPNATNSSGWVSARQAVRIPDWMSPNPGFVMDAGSPGTEGVACFATDEDAVARLPEALRGPAFKPVAGYPTLESVNVAIAQALGADQYTGNAMYWNVVPRRAPPPAPAPAPAGNPGNTGSGNAGGRK
ncbi:DUF4384 domain-containing protein [Paracidovorax wautersii]|uniref:Peptidoglycan hydrolase-like protein with peptidoglycan-binding domain n=1 Tax=Paracidovorax wautersii TaxID=1177982 RepID=A0ABU1IDV9_9BURK|nr:peptidoglycan hydrolase-like protein with peptidoglycan-binding domain [Paracidovorax wautersii]